MKFCSSHWEKLRIAIRERGLEGEVAKSGQEAVRDMVAGRPDPLMSAHLAIVSNAMNVVGLELFGTNEDGAERCPICFLVASCRCGQDVCTFETWVERAADEQLALRTKASA